MLVERTAIEEYRCYLEDEYRPPSRGGNTNAWHQHVITVAGVRYSFLARGARKWIYAGDTAGFEWEWDESLRYRNIVRETVQTWDKNGNPVRRGDRSDKPWRTAKARMPASRREQRD